MIKAKKRIRFIINRLARNQCSPDFAAANRFSRGLSPSEISGIWIKNKRVAKAMAKVAKSTAITIPMPKNPNSAEAITGCKMVFSDDEKDRRPLVFW